MNEAYPIFKCIVEQSSMNKAAQLLNLSQPALSRKIAKLEEELGAPLFRRIGKRLELTRIGQLTYDYAIEAERLHRRYMQTVAEFKETGRSSLTIGASLTTLQSTLPDLIALLQETHPEIDIKAVTGKTHEVVNYVKEHKVDIAVIASRLDDPHVQCTPLFDDHLILAMPRALITDEQRLIQLQDLNDIPMILFTKGTWYRLLTDELFEQYQLTPEIRMEIDSFEAILRLLHTFRAGALLPKSYLRQQLMADNDLVTYHIPQLEATKRTTSLIHADPNILDAAVRSCIYEIATHYQKRT
ncbi:LysR family transcriptional regulator [Paenibacillus septentrionalis]|uniref:LysR family transcriptional regulator n=1 Tax=Paenibacillus septentrionalis TaxID=429342 RepID=A0ABW1VA24_9BACL